MIGLRLYRSWMRSRPLMMWATLSPYLLLYLFDGLVAVDDAGLHQDGDDTISFETDLVYCDFCGLQERVLDSVRIRALISGG